MIRRRRSARSFVPVLLVGLLAAACGNSPDEPAAPTTEGAATDDADELGGGGNDDPGGEDDRHTFEPVDAPGVTDDEIRFASIATISSNPLGTNIGDAYNDGIEAYFTWRNSEGGIYGRDLVLASKLDDQLGRNAERAQALASGGDAFGAFVATLLFTGAPVLEENEIPTFGWGIHAEFAGQRNLFGHIAPICAGCPSRVVPYLVREAGAARVGVLGYNNSENSRRCAAGHRESIERYGEDAGGLTLAFFDDNLSFGLPGGLAPQVSAMQREGVDFVATCMDLNGVKILAEELHKQGLGDVVVHHPNSYDHAFVAANADIFEGDVVLTTFTPFEAEVDSELQREFFEWTDELEIERHELTMVGWLNAHLAFTALLGAGPDFDRSEVVDAARSLTHYTADNLVVPIDWSRQLGSPDEAGAAQGPLSCGTAVQVRDGELVPFTGEPGAPWACWDTDDDAWSEPEFVGDFG